MKQIEDYLCRMLFCAALYLGSIELADVMIHRSRDS